LDDFCHFRNTDLPGLYESWFERERNGNLIKGLENLSQSVEVPTIA